MRNTTIPIMALLVVGIFLTTSANADYGFVKSSPPVEYGDWNDKVKVNQDNSGNICVVKPLDKYIDKTAVNMIIKTAELRGKSIVLSRTDNPQGCKVVVKIDRAIQENYAYTDRKTPYVISGNTLTIFTYKTTTPINPNAEPFRPMTNWNCEIQAHETKYYSNYFAWGSDYGTMITSKCDPFAGINLNQVGELPLGQIQKSVNDGLNKMGV